MMPNELARTAENIRPRKHRSPLVLAALALVFLGSACSTEAARPYFRQHPGPTVTPLDPRSAQIPDAVLQACFNAVDQIRKSSQPEAWDGEAKCIQIATTTAK